MEIVVCSATNSMGKCYMSKDKAGSQEPPLCMPLDCY